MHPFGGNMQLSSGNMQPSGGITVYLKYTTIFPLSKETGPKVYNTSSVQAVCIPHHCEICKILEIVLNN